MKHINSKSKKRKKNTKLKTIQTIYKMVARRIQSPDNDVTVVIVG